MEEKQEKVLRSREANKTEEEKCLHLQNEGRKFGQDSSEVSGYKEEEILRFMEEQEILSNSGKTYCFILAERNDTVRMEEKKWIY